MPLYLFHRYQTEAAIKEIGGLDYRYAVRGDGQLVSKIVAPADQKKALAAVLVTFLAPEFPHFARTHHLATLPPRTPGLPRNRESFASHTGLTFKSITAAEAAADLTLAVLLDPARSSRLVQYHMRVGDAPSLRGVLESISKVTASRTRPAQATSMSSEVERAVETRAYEAMFSLAINPRSLQPGTRHRPFARLSAILSRSSPPLPRFRTQPKRFTAPPLLTASRSSKTTTQSSLLRSPSRRRPACPSEMMR